VPVGVAVPSGGAHGRINETDTRDRERFLRGALERDGRQIPAPAEIMDDEIELNPRPADENVGKHARKAWPSRSGFEAERPAGGTRLSAC